MGTEAATVAEDEDMVVETTTIKAILTTSWGLLEGITVVEGSKVIWVWRTISTSIEEA
jgi:hypothetical protein